MDDLTDFQKKVYEHVRKIPAGNVQTYGHVAREIGHPRSFRAVGTVLSKNPYGPASGCDEELVVNCHRVVPATRAVGGYFGGTNSSDQNAKRARLEAEGITFDATGRVDPSCINK